MNKLKFHELADFYPMHDKERFSELVKGMKQSGYRKEFPIVLYENKILDGRNRYLAALEADIEPFTVQFGGDDPIEFVIEANSNRRDLEPGQRVAILYSIREKYPLGTNQYSERVATGGHPLSSRDKFAEKVGVSHGTVGNVEYVMQRSPELFEKIKSGELPAKTAYKEVKALEREQERKELAKLGKKVKTSDQWKVLLGDVRDVGSQIPDNSIDLILTDPPYPEEYLYCWDALAELADRVLKPSGFVFSYSGQFHLPAVMERMSKRLEYYWTMCLEHEGGNQLIMGRNVFCGWKPILIYQKKPFKRFDGHFADTIKGSGREKGLHDWQQGEEELDYIIQNFTLEGQTILDPFCGSGTTLVASIKNKRIGFGIEIDETNYNITKKRVDDVTNNRRRT